VTVLNQSSAKNMSDRNMLGSYRRNFEAEAMKELGHKRLRRA